MMPTHISSTYKYFDYILNKYPSEKKLLLKAGKLTKEDGWFNVIQHSVTEMLILESLSKMLQISSDKTQKMLRATLCHDWDKRMEVKPDDFTKDERKKAKEMFNRLSLSKSLMSATKLQFLKTALFDKRSSFFQRILYYIDSSVMGSEFVNYKTRIQDAENRQSHPYNTMVLIKRYGRQYSKMEIVLAGRIEKEIIDKLRKRGIDINSGVELRKMILKDLRGMNVKC